MNNGVVDVLINPNEPKPILFNHSDTKTPLEPAIGTFINKSNNMNPTYVIFINTITIDTKITNSIAFIPLKSYKDKDFYLNDLIE